MKLLLAMPSHTSTLPCDTAGALINTLRHCAAERIEAEVYFLKGCSSIHLARDHCASLALKRSFDKLFFLDSDQVWTTEDVAHLLRSEQTLVGGTYPKKEYPCDLNFNALPEHSHYFPGGHKSPEQFGRYAKEADARGEIEVQDLPTGFMLIDASCLRAVAEKSAKYTCKLGQAREREEQYDLFPDGGFSGQWKSEDWFFCASAREVGHPPYLNVNVIVDHIGTHTYRVPKEVREGWRS